MNLQQLIKPLTPLKITGDANREINSVGLDSRDITPGQLFVALQGALADGHDFIDEALQKGAAAVLCERLPEKLRNFSVKTLPEVGNGIMIRVRVGRYKA